MSDKVRVLYALGDGEFRKKLMNKLPPKKFLKLPEDIPKHNYPSSFIKMLPNTYCDFGFVTEYLLRKNYNDITNDALKIITKNICEIDIPEKICNLMTTKRYISSVIETRKLLDKLFSDANVIYDSSVTLTDYDIEGHPDILTDNQVFEVKTSGKLKESWNMFLLQTFTYAALMADAKKVHIVLPLQQYIWSFDINDKSWPKRNEYLDLLKSYKAPNKIDIINNEEFAKKIFTKYKVGTHISKTKSMFGSLVLLDDFVRPYQIFITKTTNVKVTDADIAQTLALVEDKKAKIFVHTPYLLNLCIESYAENDYVVQCLKKHLEVASSAGMRGVVVHVGKYCDRDRSIAIENMRQNITRAIQSATPMCPLLLETPAGQGTETLTTFEEFMEFVTSFNDPRLCICLDTCHVFANGDMPLEYMTKIINNTTYKNYLKLIHFNDSNCLLGDKVDRHAFIGFGKMPKQQLEDVAKLAYENNIPMLVE